MKIDFKDVTQIRPCKTNMELTEIVLTNGSSVYVSNSNNQFCISINAMPDKSEVWIEE